MTGDARQRAVVAPAAVPGPTGARDVRHPQAPSPAAGAPRPRSRRFWYVTLTMRGEAVGAGQVREALERLAEDRPFVASAGYSADRAEVRYWEESPDAAGAVALALRLWTDHKDSARLPDWHVAGVEVLDRETARARWQRGEVVRPRTLGEIAPL